MDAVVSALRREGPQTAHELYAKLGEGRGKTNIYTALSDGRKRGLVEVAAHVHRGEHRMRVWDIVVADPYLRKKRLEGKRFCTRVTDGPKQRPIRKGR